jgi:hypothetical protein
MQTVLITGGTGLIGKELTKKLLSKGYKVIILSRGSTNEHTVPNLSFATWDVKNQWVDEKAIQSADHIIHLAGAGVVAKKWTSSYKKEIVESRTKSSELLISTLKRIPNNIKTIICSSAIGWYGSDKKQGYSFIESDPSDESFLGETCKLWENSIDEASLLGIRVCKLRTGIVLSKHGGALVEFIKPIKKGIAAILGNGKQVISWIHIEDLCRIFIHAIEHEQLSGPFNAVAPKPVSNKELTLTLARHIRHRFFIPVFVPSILLRWMMGESSIEILKSTTVSCQKLQATGFTFLYPTIEPAIRELMK